MTVLQRIATPKTLSEKPAAVLASIRAITRPEGIKRERPCV